jgi:signal transduction histidine kinase
MGSVLGLSAGVVEVTVDDAGPGIDPAERTKVFERFYRGSASGRRGTSTGTGLGLALVAEHMRVMHGGVRVESSPDGGARFVLSLPVLAHEVEDGDDERDEFGDERSNGPGVKS